MPTIAGMRSAKAGVALAGEYVLLSQLWIVRQLIKELGGNTYRDVAAAIDPHLTRLPSEVVDAGQQNWDIEHRIFVETKPQTRRSKPRSANAGGRRAASSRLRAKFSR
jgi:hypothetical protein